MNASTATYYERWGPVSRRALRGYHRTRRLVKSALGRAPRVLLEIRWRLGDEIMALPIYDALRRRYPDARLEVLCNHPELLEGYACVDAVNPSAPEPDLYCLLRGASRTVPRLAHYATHAGIPTPSARPELRFATWACPQLDEVPKGNGPLVALSPGASWPTKRWSFEAWWRLGLRLRDRGARLIELGVEGETIGVGTSFVGRTSVRESAVLLRHCDLAVTCDSGLMHLALAAGTPVVALFGATAPEILIEGDPHFHPITNGRTCEGCWNGPRQMAPPGVCPLGVDACLGTISVEAVAERVEQALAAGS